MMPPCPECHKDTFVRKVSASPSGYVCEGCGQTYTEVYGWEVERDFQQRASGVGTTASSRLPLVGPVPRGTPRRAPKVPICGWIYKPRELLLIPWGEEEDDCRR